MKPFEFVLIIISVIVGLALTEFAIGVAFMIQHYRTAHFYWPHLVMAAFGIISCLNYWATLYRLRKVESWTVAQIGLVFATGLIFFITTKIYFPDPNTFDLDYEAYFHANVKIIFVLMICFLVVWALEAFKIRKVRQIKKYAIMLVFILMSLSGVLIDNHLYIGILGSVMLFMQVVYMYNVRTLIAEQ
jgi:hypothetical protein